MNALEKFRELQAEWDKLPNLEFRGTKSNSLHYGEKLHNYLNWLINIGFVAYHTYETGSSDVQCVRNCARSLEDIYRTAKNYQWGKATVEDVVYTLICLLEEEKIKAFRCKDIGKYVWFLKDREWGNRGIRDSSSDDEFGLTWKQYVEFYKQRKQEENEKNNTIQTKDTISSSQPLPVENPAAPLSF